MSHKGFSFLRNQNFGHYGALFQLLPSLTIFFDTQITEGMQLDLIQRVFLTLESQAVVEHNPKGWIFQRILLPGFADQIMGCFCWEVQPQQVKNYAQRFQSFKSVLTSQVLQKLTIVCAPTNILQFQCLVHVNAKTIWMSYSVYAGYNWIIQCIDCIPPYIAEYGCTFIHLKVDICMECF